MPRREFRAEGDGDRKKGAEERTQELEDTGVGSINPAQVTRLPKP